MKLTIHSNDTTKKIQSDLESGMLSQRDLNIYNCDDGEEDVCIETSVKIPQVQKCIEHCQELGADDITITFSLSFHDAILLGKHLTAIGESSKLAGVKDLSQKIDEGTQDTG